MTWSKVQKKIKPYLIRIETQQGSGTGFLFAYNPTGSLAAIATAAHVIDHAHDWKQPIKLIHDETGKVAFVGEDQRVVFLNQTRDAATILVPKGTLPFPDTTFPIADSASYRAVGSELAWTGFPSVAYPTLCFFSGRVSAFLMQQDCYLIDGVAINGVSGGPVFCEKTSETPEIVGIISAYLPNRSGDTPGLLRAQDITPFVETLSTLQSMHEAKEREEAKAQNAENKMDSESGDPATKTDGPETEH
ncbi:MAG: trypsin-like peptidase domain-containing protein [Planctomycetales bacterium]|nr:trypsin-like peptidase domain-containing protein [Planctomycetales bacterium]